MSTDKQRSVGRAANDPSADIGEARRLLCAALEILDSAGFWQAAASVDLAVNQIDKRVSE